MTCDVRQPKTQAYVLDKLRRWIAGHLEVDVIRFTTFFHQLTLMLDEQTREKFVDWSGYSASVSPYILRQFEQEAGYRFRPEYIISQRYHNSTFCVPAKECHDFMDFQIREVARLVKKLVDITHEAGREAMMFLGDHWIGTEPFGLYFQKLGLDAVVGPVGDGRTLRLISDTKGVRYTKGRFLPYFLLDVFHEGGDPVQGVKVDWVTARCVILRPPLDRTGYGGHLKFVLKFLDSVDYIEEICNEFHELYEYVHSAQPMYMPLKVTIFNSWGALRGRGAEMVTYALWYKQIYSYSGVLEALSGMPFDVQFISFNDILEYLKVPDDAGVTVNAGDAYTTFNGGDYWKDVRIVSVLRKFICEGDGFIGVGEPSVAQKEGHFFQLYDVLGVDKEVGSSLSQDKYSQEEQPHFLKEELPEVLQLGEEIRNIYALPDTAASINEHQNIRSAANTYGKGKSVYLSGLPFSSENARLLYRCLLYAVGKETEMKKWYSENCSVEVNVYPNTNSYCVVNNMYEVQDTRIYMDYDIFDIRLQANEIRWLSISGEE